MLIENGIVDAVGKPKFTIHALRHAERPSSSRRASIKAAALLRLCDEVDRISAGRVSEH
ncbi:hypothetical protein ACOXXX_19555 [Thalassococcus sp. BH17M4-6]|uniref:hypothetical protein n=1 Tax=Thalassococcus sp. BH17M4-6 TaxID=3413148 RepID=UPI003BCD45F9